MMLLSISRQTACTTCTVTVVCAGRYSQYTWLGVQHTLLSWKFYPLAIFWVKRYVIFWGVYISLSEIFLPSVDQKNIHSNLFSVTYDVRKKCCFLTGILGVKFQTRVFFGGLQYEALLQPSPQSSILWVPHMGLYVTSPFSYLNNKFDNLHKYLKWCFTIQQLIF